MKQWKDGFKTRKEAKEYLKRVRNDGFVAKIVVDHSYGEYDTPLPYVVITTDFRDVKSSGKQMRELKEKGILGKRFSER